MTMAPPRLVGHRIDALTIAYRVDVVAHAPRLAARALDADELGRVEFDLLVPDDDGRAMRFELVRTRALARYYLENAIARVMVDLNAAGRDSETELPAWSVEVVFRAMYLATHTYADALAYGARVAAAFGEVKGERMRRIDLAADFEGWRLARADAECFCKHGRARLTEFHPEERATAKTYGQSTRSVTGFTVGSGGPMMLRLYNKTTELALPDREHKREVEQAGWTRNGWTGGSVTRLEFQFRGAVLDELNLRNPRDVPARIDSVWAYATRSWVRLVEPGTATRQSRCKLDARWDAAQAVTFFHQDHRPAFRVRMRACAEIGQVIGVLLSHAQGYGELSTATDFARSLSEREIEAVQVLDRHGMTPEQYISILLDEVFAKVRDQAVEALTRTRGAHNAAKLIATLRANSARFSP